MKTLVGVNTLATLDQFIYANHLQFWYRVGKNYPNDTFFFFTPPRMSIDRMRNSAAKLALEQECDYLMFIDDDVLIPPSAFTNLRNDLEKYNYDILAGHTVIRGYPYNQMFFKDIEDGGLTYYNDYKDNINENGIVDCGAVGFSCVLIRCQLLKEIYPPYFITGTHHTEDVYFCMKARKENNRQIKIGVHTKVETGHLGDRRVYTPSNIEFYKDLDERENPKLLNEKQKDRGDKYLEKCLALT